MKSKSIFPYNEYSPKNTLFIFVLAIFVYLMGSIPSHAASASGPGPSQGNSCPNYTFECLHPEFLKTQISPAYWQYESAISPAEYNPAHNDFISQFLSPSGKQVRIVVKSPITTKEYDVPPIASGEKTYQYFHTALYDAQGNQRTQTIIKFPKNIYNFHFPVTTNCSYHWPLPAGATDLVIDGQGSTVNFTGLCNGLNLPNVKRVVIKNFTFQWPHVQIASVGTITAVGGNGNTGYTYNVHFGPIAFGPQPQKLAAITSWDKAANHWDLVNWGNDVSYGDGVSNGPTGGIPLTCVESPQQQKTSGCTVKGITSYGVLFKVGESVLLRFYDNAGAVVASGQDITFDNITFKNVIGFGIVYNEGQGRGFRVTHSTLTRMDNQPISCGGNASIITGISGDVVFDNNFFGYQADDAFDMNTSMVRYTPPSEVNSFNTPMPTIAFNASIANQLQWPYPVQGGDTFAIFDNTLNFQGVFSVKSVNRNNIVTLDQNIGPSLGNEGFIAADITQAAGARYLISHNTFLYNRSGALVLHTPFGWVKNNRFIGQTMAEMSLSSSLYWGEGLGAQELTISNNLFDDIGRQGDFIPLNMMTQAANFPNNANEVANLKSAAPSVNQNIIVADNLFISDQITAVVNLSSVNNNFFGGNHFDLTKNLQNANETDQFPISVHDASNIYFGNRNAYSPQWLSQGSCTQSRLLNLTTPSAQVSAYPPAACGITATTSNLIFEPSGEEDGTSST